MKIARFLLQSMVIDYHFAGHFLNVLSRWQMVKVNHSSKYWGYFIIINPFFRKNKAFSFIFFDSNICTKFQFIVALAKFSQIFTISWRPVLLGDSRIISTAYTQIPIPWIWHPIVEQRKNLITLSMYIYYTE